MCRYVQSYAKIFCMKKSVVFFGSPDFAVPSLTALLKEYDVRGVVSQPDRPSGRGKVMTSPPVKLAALTHEIPVLQPNRLKDPGVVEQLKAWDADVYIVAAFGQIFRKNILEIPKFGLINVHASLLPRWRGAAPIQAAIVNGDQQTGISIMKIDEGIDTGDVFSQRSINIYPFETAGELSVRLAEIGAELLLETLPGILDGSLVGKPQDDRHATYAGMIRKEDGILDIHDPAEYICRKVRAYQPWPGTKLIIDDQAIAIHKAHYESKNQINPGKRLIIDGLPAVSVIDGIVVFEQIQLPGKKPVDGRSFLLGNKSWGERI